MIRYLFLGLALLCICGEPKSTKTETSDKKDLQGSWRILAFDYDGYWLSAFGPVGEYYRSLKVTFTDKRISIKADKKARKPAPVGIEFIWDHAYSIDPSRRPMEIDVRILVWSANGEATETERVWPGIYELQGDRLVICIDRSWNTKRPKEFSIVRGRSHTIMLLEREKE